MAIKFEHLPIETRYMPSSKAWNCLMSVEKRTKMSEQMSEETIETPKRHPKRHQKTLFSPNRGGYWEITEK